MVLLFWLLAALLLVDCCFCLLFGIAFCLFVVVLCFDVGLVYVIFLLLLLTLGCCRLIVLCTNCRMYLAFRSFVYFFVYLFSLICCWYGGLFSRVDVAFALILFVFCWLGGYGFGFLCWIGDYLFWVLFCSLYVYFTAVTWLFHFVSLVSLCLLVFLFGSFGLI